jgi:hypothetical protein
MKELQEVRLTNRFDSRIFCSGRPGSYLPQIFFRDDGNDVVDLLVSAVKYFHHKTPVRLCSLQESERQFPSLRNGFDERLAGLFRSHLG